MLGNSFKSIIASLYIVLMAYLNDKELQSIGFKHLGNNVKISDKVSIYTPEKISIGDNCRIDDFCVLSGSITLGRNIHISLSCNVSGGQTGIEMADFSTLSYSVNVFTQSDDYSGQSMTNPTVPNEFTNVFHSPVRIGKHVVVGAGSMVFPGVEISDGCSIGAMTLVSKSTDPWGIYVGIPARRIKDRSSELLELEAQYLAQG